MAKKQRTDRKEQESIIPALKSEEKQLEAELEEARGQAARIVQAAEEGAAAHVATVESSLPEIAAKLRASRIAAVERTAEEMRQASGAETERLARDAERRMPEAIRFIVSRVWPKGGQ